MPSSSQVGDSDASWDTLPITQNNRSRPANTSVTIFPKQVFHALAAVLIVSLSLLLVELNSPGIASRLSGSLFGTGQATVAINAKSYYSPVPAPFLTPKSSKLMEMFVPTSEPTILRGMTADANAPTSEPTEYKDRMGQFMVNVPTSEPTEVRETELDAHYVKQKKQTKLDARTPTEEPTVFMKTTSSVGTEPTSEPTAFVKNSKIGSGPTSEPTVFLKETFQNADQPTHEPTTMRNAGQPGEPTGEPTTFQAARHPGEPTSEPTTFKSGSRPGEPTPEPTTYRGVGQPTEEPTVFNHNGEGNSPTNEPTSYSLSGSGHKKHSTFEPTNEPTPAPSARPSISSWNPTSFISIAPTSDPTVFPTPEPTPAI